jgi:RimJ/RimL family protein N-acetyltransferase
MTDLAKYSEIKTLKNGKTVLIRPVRTDDKDRFAEAFRNLEKESIYTRFFYYKKALTDADLKAATEIDFEKVVALVVTIGEGEDETIIGGGRYVVFDSATKLSSAEVAFTVEEDYQGQGIASLLLQKLASIACEKGVSQFVAEVLAENKAMLGVFSRSGLPVNEKLERGVMHITLSLTEESS